MGDENICAICVDDPIEEKKESKLYKSIYPGNLPPSYSTFNNKTTTHHLINNPGGDYKLHTGYRKPTASYAFWGKPKVFKEVAASQAWLAQGKLSLHKCKIEVRKPALVPHLVYKTDKEEVMQFMKKHKEEKEKKRAQSAKPILKQNDRFERESYGKVPEYLVEMKRKRDEENNNKIQKPEKKKMTVEELNELIKNLKKRFQELSTEYCKYSHKICDVPKVKAKLLNLKINNQRKEQIEKDLTQVEKDMVKIDKLLRSKK